MDFPRTVYKSPGKTRYNKTITYDAIIVRDEKELMMCEKKGFIDNFNDALFLKKAKVIEDKPDWKQMAIDAGLEGEELKKFMKKSSENRKKYLDKLKG